MSEIITKIDSAVKRFHMLNTGDTVVAGVSGGADSMLMLSYLLSIKDEYNLDIIVANVEHGIRGDTSKADSQFVKNFCAENNIRFEMLSINAPEEAKAQKIGVEEYSRNRRYEFFCSFGADKIAVAHNLSDNVETVLFRLARGTSIKGCAGIPPVRDNIIRPLIYCTSEEIRSECEKQGIPYVIDETNSDNDYSRNFVRNELVPLFCELNPSFEQAVSRFSESAREDSAFIEKCADECIECCSCENGLSVSKLKEYDVAVIKRVFIKLVEEYGITPDEKHLNSALEILSIPKKKQIKDNVFLSSGGGVLRAFRINNKNNFSLSTEIVTYNDFVNFDDKSRYDMYCDADKVCGEPYVRARQDGDAISPVKRKCTKSLKKLFNELKIPAEKRDSLPIICDDFGIIGIPSVTIDERVKVDNDTNNVILFKIHLEDNN